MKPPVKTIISVFLSVIMTFSVIVTANASEVTEEPTIYKEIVEDIKRGE